MNEELCNIIKAARKHPNSRVAKLIHTVQEEPSRNNIILLLNEIAEHSEYAVDFDISLQYYMNLFQNLEFNYDTIMNEAGLFLVSATNVYSKRIDHVHSHILEQALSLTSAEIESQKKTQINKPKDVPTAETIETGEANKPPEKRSKKRPLETQINRYDIELKPKKIRKLNNRKRFALPDQNQPEIEKQKQLNRYKRTYTQYVHPGSWLCGTMYDLEYADEIDNKRNYKMYTYHVEHRYNTLVSDINFRLHFKMKDFIEEENEKIEVNDENNMCHIGGRKWPPLSEAYIQQYIDLENRVLGQEHSDMNTVQIMEQSANFTYNEVLNVEMTEMDINEQHRRQQDNEEEIESARGGDSIREEDLQIDSTIDFDSNNLCETFNNNSAADCTNYTSLISEGYHTLANTLNNTTDDNTKASDDAEIDLSRIRVHLPHLDDEGVYISDLDEADQKMLCPRVLATDVFPSVPDKNNITIIINDELRSMFGIEETQTNKTEVPTILPTKAPIVVPLIDIHLNICKFPEKLLKKRVLFKLGAEMDIYIKPRTPKRMRNTTTPLIRQYRQLKRFPLNDTNLANILMTPPESPAYLSDFNGFEDDASSTLNLYESDESNDFMGFDDAASLDSGMDMEMNAPMSCNTICDETLNGDVHENVTIDPNQNHAENENDHNEAVGNNDVNAETVEDCSMEDNTADQEQEGTVELCDIEPTDLVQSKLKVQEWHDYLQPILAASRQRHHFDVFQLGTEIIDSIQSNSKGNHSSSNSNELAQSETEALIMIDENSTRSSSNGAGFATGTFMDIMRNKDKSFVSRYFLSTLLLINQNNLELNIDSGNDNENKGNKPIEWHDMKLTLKSIKRYNVSEEDNIGLLDKSIGHKPKEKDKLPKSPKRPMNDTNTTCRKNTTKKKKYNNVDNNEAEEQEIHDTMLNINETNETEYSTEYTSSTPKSDHPVNWKMPRISNIIPLKHVNESFMISNSSHTQNNIIDNNINDSSNDERPCSSQMNNKKHFSVIKLKKFEPLPVLSKTPREMETDSGIFSHDDYHS